MSFYPLTDLHEAIAAANAPPMAFQASIFTENLYTALDAAERLDASAVMVNDHTAFRTDWMPWAAPVRLRHRRHSRDDAGDDPTEDDRLSRCRVFPIGLSGPTSGVRMRVAVWREQDAMRQCKIRFGVIPRSFRDEKESIPPHCSRQD